jgi:hypothetical protein
MSRTNRLRVEALEAREVPAGDLAYALPLTGLPADVVTRVVADPVGNVYVTGTFSGTVDLDPSPTEEYKVTARAGTDVFVAKYGYTGELVWARTLNGKANESAADIAVDGIGNVYVAGTFTGALDFNPDPQATASASAAAGGSAFVWKLDYNGNFFLARTVNGTSSASGLAVDTRGNILVAGLFKGSADFNPSPTVTEELTTENEDGAMFAWKLDRTGTLGYARAFHTTADIEPSVVFLDGNGNGYVSGRFTGTADLDPSTTSKSLVAAGSVWTPFVTKLGFAGNFVWGKSLRTVSAVSGISNAITGMSVDGIGNVYAAGTFAGTADFDPGTGTSNLTSTGNSADGFAWKLDASGALVYARRFGGAGAETLTDLGLDKAGNVYLTGTFTGVADFDPGTGIANLGSGSGAADTYVLKLSPTGNLVYTRSLGGAWSTTRATGIFADGAGNMYLTGGFSGKADFEPSNLNYALGGGAGSGFIVKLWPPASAAPKPNNLPPTKISAGGPYTIKEGEGLTVKASAVDLEGKPLEFIWDLNGDGVFGDAFGDKVVLTPRQMALLNLQDGTNNPRTVQVRIKDGVNLPVVASTTLKIENIAPTAKLVAPATGVEGVRPLIKYKAVSDPSIKDMNRGLKASWDFNDDGVWDLGDGSTYAGSVAGAQKVPATLVADSGPIQVRVRVFDKDGGYHELTTTIELAEKAPTAVFAPIGTGFITSGSPITFRFTNPTDAPADKAAGFTYGFDFDNDGVYEVVGSQPQASTVFPARGIYTVRGIITDQDGTSTVYELNVDVVI